MEHLNGYMVRPGSLDDMEAAVKLFNACSMAISGKKQYSVEEVKAQWNNPGFNIEKDSRAVLTPEGDLIAWGQVWATRKPYVRMWTWCQVHPDYRRQGIGTYLAEWTEARTREFLPLAPEGTRVVIIADCDTRDEATIALFEAQNMTHVRYFWRMVIELDQPVPEPQWADGITIRHMRDDDHRQTYAAVRDSFKDHWGHVENPFEEGLAQWNQMLKDDASFDTTLFFLAMDGDEIAGFSLGWPYIPEDKDMGWISTLGVRREWRRTGIALALLHHTFGVMAERGKKRVGLVVDAANLTGATRLYEKAGMGVSRQYATFEKVLRDGEDISTQAVPEE